MSEVSSVHSSLHQTRLDEQNRRNGRIFVVLIIALTILAVVGMSLGAAGPALALSASVIIASKVLGVSSLGILIVILLIDHFVHQKDPHSSRFCYKLDSGLQEQRSHEMQMLPMAHKVAQAIFASVE